MRWDDKYLVIGLFGTLAGLTCSILLILESANSSGVSPPFLQVWLLSSAVRLGVIFVLSLICHLIARSKSDG